MALTGFSHVRANAEQPTTGRPRRKRGEDALGVLHRAALHEQLAGAADGPLAAYNERAHAKAARIESEALLTPTSPTGHLVKRGGEIVEIDRGLDGYTEPIPFAIRNDLRRVGKHLR